MTSEEIQLLHRACQAAGVDATKIRGINPFTKSGFTASLLQGAVAEIDPVQAEKWRVDADQGMNLATLNEIQTGGNLSEDALKDRWNHDPEFVVATIQAREQNEQALIEQMDSEVDRLRRQRDGDAAVDFQNAKAAAEAETKAESLRRSQQLQQRIAEQQAHCDRISGRFIS